MCHGQVLRTDCRSQTALHHVGARDPAHASGLAASAFICRAFIDKTIFSVTIVVHREGESVWVYVP